MAPICLRSSFLLLLVWVVLATPSWVAAEPPPSALPSVVDAPEEEPPPTWRFRDDDRPIKVVVLAGSIGAYNRDPYARWLQTMCSEVEVENLSKSGEGAWALKRRFRAQVLENRNARAGAHGELWLVFGGGLNSVGTPERTNRWVRELYVMAHRRGIKVLALTLTPWGDDDDARWRGYSALQYRRATTKVVDYARGKASPKQALGVYAHKRKQGALAPWDDDELPDLSVDLYDSELRDADAPMRDIEEAKRALVHDRAWHRAHAELDEPARNAALERDARELAETPRWYLREEFRSFDHIHLNARGHRQIATEMCPKLPRNWGCTCPPAREAPKP